MFTTNLKRNCNGSPLRCSTPSQYNNDDHGDDDEDDDVKIMKIMKIMKNFFG